MIQKFLNSMFDGKDASQRSLGASRLSSSSNEEQASLRDALFSLTHRIAALENSINSKIDRAECLHLLEGKTTHSHLRKLGDQVTTRVEEEIKKMLEQTSAQQKASEASMKKLVGKLAKSNSKGSVKPQELYLESNQTMFSMVVDEIVSLKQSQAELEKSLDHRHRVNLNINNEVCAKLEKMEKELELSMLSGSAPSSQKIVTLQTMLPSQKGHGFSDKTIKDKNIKVDVLDSQVEPIRFNHLQRIVEGLQKDLASKLSIKDLMPMIKKNTEQLGHRISEMKNYTEEAIESTKKILVHQSEINQELCSISKVGWWQSFEEHGGFAVWNKELANMLPEVFIFEKNTSSLFLAQQGYYLIKVVCPDGETDLKGLVVNGEDIGIRSETVVRCEKDCSLKVRWEGEVLLMIHKL